MVDETDGKDRSLLRFCVCVWVCVLSHLFVLFHFILSVYFVCLLHAVYYSCPVSLFVHSYNVLWKKPMLTKKVETVSCSGCFRPWPSSISTERPPRFPPLPLEPFHMSAGEEGALSVHVARPRWWKHLFSEREGSAMTWILLFLHLPRRPID